VTAVQTCALPIYIIIVQNKVDLVDKETALKNYRQIKEFVKGTVAENAPIIPAAAHYGINIPEIIKAIQENIPTPKRDVESPGRMFVARSFDVNKPGTPVADLVGGVLGGSVIRGQLKAGDEVEIRPGIETKKGWKALKTKATSLSTKDGPLDSAVAGGLVGIGTELDPSLTKNDKLVGSLVGAPGTLPECRGSLVLNVTLIERMVDALKIEPVKPSEILVINIGTATTVGTVAEVKGKRITLALKKPVCCESGWKAAISRRIANRWRLIGYGTVA
jgi:translation initiation factor 2 subunit 3